MNQIAEKWKQMRLGEILDYVKGRKPDKIINEFNKSYIPYLSTDYLRNNEFAKFAIANENVITVDEGDIILLWDGSNAGEFFMGKKGILSSTMVKIKIKDEKVNRKFLFFALKKLEYILRMQTRGTGVPHVDKSVLESITITIPPLPEQEKIAEILGTVDEAIEKVDQSIEKTERLKKGLMQELLTKGIGHRGFKDTKIGKIPKEWNVGTLDETNEINKESTDPHSRLTSRKFFYIDIDSIENEIGKIGGVKKLIGKDAPSRARRVIHEDDVIMSTVRPYLKAFAIVPKEYDNQVCSTGFAVLSCKNLLLPKYLLYVLFSKMVINQCKRMMVGGQYPALNISQVAKIRIPIPPFSEQKRIVEILSTVDKKIELEKEKECKLQRIKKGLMQDLLTGKRRVKV